MKNTEKATYCIYGRGHDPDKLRLGNLVMDPRNPAEEDSYTCPSKLQDMKDWTGKPMEEAELTICQAISHDKGASANVTGLGGAEISQSKGSTLKIKGEKAERFQIQEATDFLAKKILTSPEAHTWLRERITLSKNMLLLRKLRMMGSRRPQIWMITGIQMISDATVYSNRTETAKMCANAQIPTPEATSAVLTAIGSFGQLLKAEVSGSRGGHSIVESQHKGKLVWAAQFRRLKLEFVDDDASKHRAAETSVSLEKLLHLGVEGMKGVSPANDEIRAVVQCSEDMATEDENLVVEGEYLMTKDEKKMMEQLNSAPKKHAILIGGSESELDGVRNDIDLMASLFVDCGFQISLCYGEGATRNGIIESWHNFIQMIPQGSNNAVVVYYSGHGGASVSKRHSKGHRIQYLLPHDIQSTTTNNFRGILDIELSHFITQLTNRTHNVTIIIDCCHSERVARGKPQEKGRRAWSPCSFDAIENHIRRLEEKGFYNNLNPEGNRHAVRVVAAASDAPAFEDEGLPELRGNQGSGSRSSSKMGKFTRELISELRTTSGHHQPWDLIMLLLRSKLNMGEMSQRPTVEGPMGRVPFSLERLPYWGKVRVKEDLEGSFILMGSGMLAGVQEEDEYSVMPKTALAPQQAGRIAIAKVETVRPTTALVSLTFCGDNAQLPRGAIAFPSKRRRKDCEVAMGAIDEGLCTELNQGITNNGHIYIKNDEENTGSAALATISQDHDKLVLTRGSGPAMEFFMLQESAHGDAVTALLFQLEKLILASQLLKLQPSSDNQNPDRITVVIEFGKVKSNVFKPFGKFDTETPEVKEDERVNLIIRNEAPSPGHDKLFASVFLVTSMGTIEWRSHGSPSGVELLPGQEYSPGQDSHGPPKVKRKCMRGQKHAWPEAVPRQGTLDEAYVVILSDKRALPGFWENYIPKAKGKAREPGEEEEAGELDDVDFKVIVVKFKLVPDEKKASAKPG